MPEVVDIPGGDVVRDALAKEFLLAILPGADVYSMAVDEYVSAAFMLAESFIRRSVERDA